MMTGACVWPSARPCGEPALHRDHCSYHYRLALRTGWLRSTLGDPAIVRARIQEHQDRGTGLNRLSRRTGCTRNALRRIRDGEVRHVQADTVRRIMGAWLRPTHIGCARRVHALRTIGWPMDDIAARAGIGLSTLSVALRAGRFSEPVAVALASLYGELSCTHGPSAEVTRLARAEGHAPPAAWDDLDMDDPAVVPDPGSTGRRTADALVGEWRHLMGLGVPEHVAVRQLGVHPDTIKQAIRRVGRAVPTTPAPPEVDDGCGHGRGGAASPAGHALCG